MSTLELATYVREARAVGHTAEDIRSRLLAAGWDPALVEKALSGLPAAKPKARRLPAILIIAVALVLLAVAAAAIHAWYLRRNDPAAAQQPGAAAPEASALTKYSDTGISFSYPSGWSKIAESSIVSGTLSATPAAGYQETTYLFLSASHLAQATSDMDSVSSAGQGAGFLGAINSSVAVGNRADVTVIRETETTAKDAADNATRSICTGSSSDYSSENPVDESRIQATTVNGQPAYILTPASSCDTKTLNIFLDSTKSLARPTPSLAPGVTLLGGDAPVPDSFDIMFNGASDVAGLTGEQKAVLDSLKVQ